MVEHPVLRRSVTNGMEMLTDIFLCQKATSRQWRNPGILFGGGGGVQQIQLRTGDRENGDLGAVAP